MILVTCANGHLGGATIDFLLKKIKPGEIAGMVRNPQKAENLQAKGIEVRRGDYYDSASMDKAFAGVKTLGLISSGSIEARAKQHTEAVGKPIEYVDIPTEAMREGMKKSGLDEGAIRLTVSLVESIKNNEVNVQSDDLEKLLGRKPASLAEFFRSVFAQKN